jgi:hypothetical protein
LVNLLFQVDNNDFREEITSKPYSKYVYQSVKKRPKTREKGAFFKAILEQNLEHLYALNPEGKAGYCFFCPKKSNLGLEKKKPLRKRFHGK